MSGLLALVDDIAALARVAAVQVDDIAAQAGKAAAKTAGVVIDDSAVTPKYVHGLPAARELPIVWKIARGSLFNKLIILLPVAMLLHTFAPWVLIPLLMIGGAYLCFEGAEKVYHLFVPHEDHGPRPKSIDAAHLEKERVAGAIKTDFILSAEIMTIALAAIESQEIWKTALILAVVAVGITLIVYGSVAILVKADDVGLRMAQTGHFSITRALGRGIVKAMPSVMNFISTVGTLAMLWVGGSIIVHGLTKLGYPQIEEAIHEVAVAVAGVMPSADGALTWAVTAGLDGIFGLLVGFLMIPFAAFIFKPIASVFQGKPGSADQHAPK